MNLTAGIHLGLEDVRAVTDIYKRRIDPLDL